MADRMLVLFWGILFVSSCCAPSATAAAAADVPTPTAWPIRFHALLVENNSGELAVINLWYDWEKGGNLLNIQRQMVSASIDMEWTNGTSFFWDTDAQTCRTVEFEVGILRPDWLRDAVFLGVKEETGFTCNAFSKSDFITYYEDAVTGYPVYWRFYTGREVHVITFTEGAVLSDEKWQAPEYCFPDGQTAVPEKSVFGRRRESPFLTEYKDWVLSGAVSA